MTDRAFVPDEFSAPHELLVGPLRLEPLGPRHNADDHAAWTSSIEHIRATPGFAGRSWPPAEGMPLAENLRDLERHADDFARRTGFTYTVIDTSDDKVAGCVYIYPARDDEHDAVVSSWVRADLAEFDKPLHDAVAAWLKEHWPFARVEYASRDR
jgi:hypothetical protein